QQFVRLLAHCGWCRGVIRSCRGRRGNTGLLREGGISLAADHRRTGLPGTSRMDLPCRRRTAARRARKIGSFGIAAGDVARVNRHRYDVASDAQAVALNEAMGAGDTLRGPVDEGPVAG